MNRVQRAIILAAGKGERMAPLTDTVPKPLIKVNNVPMIESAIQALRENGIVEIYIVVGYLKEQFVYLTSKYKGIELIENPYYNAYNNISSLYVAREHLANAFVLDGDQVIYNNGILNPLFGKSGYNAVWTEKDTQEWLMQTNTEKKVVSCSKKGGSRGWQLFSISRWSKKDAAVLKQKLEEEFFIRKNHSAYWDDIPMFLYAPLFDLTVYEMHNGDIVEIDSIAELKAIDKSYH